MPTWLLVALGGTVAWLLLRSAGSTAATFGSGVLPAAVGLSDSVPFTVGGIQRSVWVYVPQGLPAGAPLVFLFNDTDGGTLGNLSQSGLKALADAQKLVVIAVDARVMSTGDWDQHRAGQRFYETYPNTSAVSNNELQLVDALIPEAVKVYGCDPRRVYTMGLSNGAFTAYFVAAGLQGKIAGFAEASGGLVPCPTTASCDFTSVTVDCAAATQWCAPSCSDIEKPIPLPAGGFKFAGYLTHAFDDDTVSAYYSCNLAARMQSSGYPVQTNFRAMGGHTWPPNFAQSAWQFLAQYAT